MTDLAAQSPTAWLTALGMDLSVTASIIDVAMQLGAAAQLDRVAEHLPHGVLLGQRLIPPPASTPAVLEVLFETVRRGEAVPVSPEVAEAMDQS